jgi:predicted transcriptional regulator
MQLNKTELEILVNYVNSITQLAKALNKSKSQISRSLNSLEKKGFIENKQLQRLPYISLLLQALKNNSQLTNIIHDSSFEILLELNTPKSIKDLSKRFKTITIYKTLQKFKKYNLVKKTNNLYSFNSTIWPDLSEFINSYQEYSKNIDSRVPLDSKIYYKTEKEILFSNSNELDAKKTAFSAYDFKLLLTKNYYFLPNKKLSLKQIFQHSLLIMEQEYDYKYFIFLILFYLKHKKEINHLKSPTLELIKDILNKKIIKGYPTYDEIKERAQVYDIKI